MNKKFIDFILKSPHFVFSLILSFSLLGLVGLFNIKQKLFPDTSRPQVAVLVIEKGASAKDIAENVVIPIEKQLYTLNKIRKVSSKIKDEVAIITAEFEYGKDIGEATAEVQNEVNKVKPILPKNIQEPQIYKITDTTKPVLVISVSSKNKDIPLPDLRELVENDIKDEIIKLPDVANVDVFGGYKKEVLILIDKDKLNQYGLSISEVLRKIQQINIDTPIGFVINNRDEFLIKSTNKGKTLEEIRNIYITPNIKLKDIAQVKYDTFNNKSLFYGNGKKAIALAVQRQISSDTLKTIEEVKKKVEELKRKYPNLNFEITDTQEEIIRLSNINMLEALRDAIIMTSLVIFFFLANLRQMFISAIAIPFVYGITIAFMWILGIGFNIVSLTGVILALGMLIDNTVVVLENIERHLNELKEDIKTAVINGTKEVVFPILGGTISTAVVLIPLLFVGGFPERIFRPLAETLLIAVSVSYLVSITFIPIVAPLFLKRTNKRNRLEEITLNISEKILTPLKNLYVYLVSLVFRHKKIAILYFIGIMILFIGSVRLIIPIVGREIMPPMDTGIVKGKIVTDSNLSIDKMEEIVKRLSEIIKNDKNVKMFYIAVGSEPGVFSMGKAETPQTINISIHYVDRFSRDRDIWEIERDLIKKIWSIPNIKYVNIFDYGATPLSTIKGNLDIRISGDNLKVLDNLGTKFLEVAYRTKGLTNVSKSWDYDKVVYNIKIDKQKALKYGLTPYTIALQLSSKIKGIPVSILNIPNEKGLTIKVSYKDIYRDNILDIENLYIDTPKGKIPLSSVGSLEKEIEPTLITREGLNYTIDIIGYRQKAAISHIVENFDKELKKADVKIPPDYQVSHEGDIKEMNDAMKRMLKAIGIGIVLLFFALAPVFKSFLSPIAVIFAIPLSIIGASWSILIMGYHQSMPGMMGIVLLAGIITNNSILLIDFIQEALKKGKNLEEAIIESIKIRTRPVLMTAFGTSAGLVPIALGMALGLERLAPLGTVAIGGLIVGTFLTLVYVPLFYYFLIKISNRLHF